MAGQRRKSPSKPKYLYAIINGSEKNIPPLKGMLDKKVYLVAQGTMAAVVSDVKQKKMRPQRRNLAAHQKVLNALLDHCTPLPVTFGVVADGSNAVKQLLSTHREILGQAFDRVRGKMEMGLRATWCVPNIFEFFTETHATLRKERDRLYGRRHDPSKDQKIELGSLFDRLLQSDRDQHTATVEALLNGCCAEIKRGPCRDELRIMDLACLVERGAQQTFEKQVLRAAGEFDNNVSFDFTGPWVPHSFVNLRLEV